MIVYNITIKIDPQIERDWLEWQKTEHIPDIMASGQFTAYKMFRLLDQEDEDGVTFVIQYFASTIENYQRYITETAPLLRQRAIEKWGDKFLAFRTVMEAVE